MADTESFVTCRNFIAEIFYEHNLGNNLMKFQGLQSRAAFMETIDVLPRRRRQGFCENSFQTEAVTLVMQQLRRILNHKSEFEFTRTNYTSSFDTQLEHDALHW